MTTAAAIVRLAHRSVLVESNNGSDRVRRQGSN